MNDLPKMTPEQIRELALVRQKRWTANPNAFRNSRERIESITRVATAMLDGPCTVPEIVESTGLPSPEVFWCVTAMKKYGLVNEGAKDGSYFRYSLEEAALPEHADSAEA